MQTLLDCRSCSGFIPPGAGACPCCGAPITEPPRAKRAGAVGRNAALGFAATALMAVSLMACYGLPMCSDGDKVDEDKDGYYADGSNCVVADPDCNDGDAKIHPGADDPEGDDIDQNCDGKDGIAGTGGAGGGGGMTSSGGGGTGGMSGGTGGM